MPDSKAILRPFRGNPPADVSRFFVELHTDFMQFLPAAGFSGKGNERALVVDLCKCLFGGAVQLELEHKNAVGNGDHRAHSFGNKGVDTVY